MLYGDILSREWLFLKVREWYDTNSKCLLLIGSPGAGKSVLCAQLSHYMAQCAGLFFLEWNNAESRILKNILRLVRTINQRQAFLGLWRTTENFDITRTNWA